jgi:Ca2+-binding EF-hand superfamily protein
MNDRNRDGYLSQREVPGGRRAFHRLDQNRDGAVSHFEHRDAARERFVSFDANRDGWLTSHEIGRSGGRS